ncbi:uncharacterized protein YukE [Saccharothrix ecbatanensis]|uniref:Uncharacterized protein YukE n=1 Tax=Saccharothrix ecbatanensis TaxID=1105145 RepID=A0A7W9HGZ8_9PSEU|nr:hypothetical protein [Saccharothrix ecbatanensis]MBB5802025.1 uncharacterized protein YukE [Saccharothrix ecbatanensis]
MGDVIKAAPKAIELLGDLVQRQSVGIAAHIKALERNQVSDIGQGLFQEITGHLESLRFHAQDNTRRALSLAGSSAVELAGAARFYGATDLAEADRLDKTYPTVPTYPRNVEAGELPAGVASSGFTDVVETRYYNGPGETSLEKEVLRDKWPMGLEDKLAQWLSPGDLGSVAAMADKIAQKILGWSPLGRITEVYSGDWDAIYRESVVIADTGTAFDGIVKNLQRGRYAIQEFWDGNAAAAAAQWLDRFTLGCAEHAKYCHDVAKKVSLLAEAAFHLYQTIGFLLETLIDAIVALLTAMRGKPVLKFLGTIADVATGGQARFIGSIIGIANKIQSAVDQLWAIAHGFAAVVQTVRAEGDGVRAIWPWSHFDHPAAS